MAMPHGPEQEDQDRSFMELALSEAEVAAAAGQVPFGAVVVSRTGQLLGKGHNTVSADRDPAAHAEIVAIRDAWRRAGSWQALTGCTIYTSCEPCLLCSFVIFQIGFGRVVFAASGRDVPGYAPLLGGDFAMAAAWVNAQPDWAPIAVEAGFMRDRSLEILEAFPWEEASSAERPSD